MWYSWFYPPLSRVYSQYESEKFFRTFNGSCHSSTYNFFIKSVSKSSQWPTESSVTCLHSLLPHLLLLPPGSPDSRHTSLLVVAQTCPVFAPVPSSVLHSPPSNYQSNYHLLTYCNHIFTHNVFCLLCLLSFLFCRM